MSSIGISFITLGKYMTAFPEYIKGRKTPIYEITNQKNELIKLGYVKYNSRWRKYCFYPNDETVFDDKCLLEMIKFLDYLNDVRKIALKEIKEEK